MLLTQEAMHSINNQPIFGIGESQSTSERINPLHDVSLRGRNNDRRLTRQTSKERDLTGFGEIRDLGSSLRQDDALSAGDF